MNRNQQAIRPDFMANFPLLKKDEEAAKKGVSEDERDIYAMSQMSGWKKLEGYIYEWKKQLDQLNTKAMEQGASFEEIGKNTVIINLAKGIIENIEHKVNDSIEACERPE